MRKIRIISILAIMAVILSFNGYAVAKSSSESSSAAGAWVSYDGGITYADEVRQYTGVVAGAPPISGIPLYKGAEWKLYIDPLSSELSLKDLESMRRKANLLNLVKPWKWKIHTRVSVRDDSLKGNKDPVKLINWDIRELAYATDKKLGEVITIGEPWYPLDAGLGEVLYKLKEKTGAPRAAVYVLVRQVSKIKGASIGPGASVGRMIGPSGKVDDEALVVAGGGLVGTTEGEVLRVLAFQAIGLNEGLTVGPKMSEPQGEKKSKAEAKKLPSIEYYSSPIHFGFNSSDIPLKIIMEKSNQTIRINNDEALLDLAEKLKKIAPELKKNGEVIAVMGGADIRGEEAHNDWLGNERAEAVADYLIKLGVPSDKIKLVASSMGKRQPQFKEHWKNRVVVVYRAKSLTGLLKYEILPVPSPKG